MKSRFACAARLFASPSGEEEKGEVDQLGLKAASQVAAARELFEETGLDLRGSLHLLRPLHFGAELQKKLGTRVFFETALTDADSVHLQDSSEGLTAPLSGQSNFFLRLSCEHTGFYFEADAERAADAVHLHSGGKCSMAIAGMKTLYRPEDCCMAGLLRLSEKK
eukprot:TRINITY_DN21633_c0_g1_i1.p1 TRINITY_DN21633_c0_g1~~TRINITY_DN21633_c0_g1_i1.p1  ORF type:complete len:165 (+),score=37.67 TRINITY_DN21633_c0_g1_i1:89-583(+)